MTPSPEREGRPAAQASAVASVLAFSPYLEGEIEGVSGSGHFNEN